MARCIIIAEAGVNHNGSVDLALRLVDAAVAAGADVVKFQTFHAASLASRSAPKAQYQQISTEGGASQIAMLRKLELSKEDHRRIQAYCTRQNISFLSTPFDVPSIDFLTSLGMSTFKIPSGEITNLPYLRKIGRLGKNIILSTGMSTLAEVAAALHILESAGTLRSRITLLHCTTQYPAPPESVNLRAMLTLRDAFPGIAGTGYSDHTQGIEIPLAAATLGATVIEKHFTLDRTMEGPDHKASLEPQELRAMVAGIRRVESALGDGVKAPAQAELPNIVVARKSLVAMRSIKKGEKFSEENITAKRPGNGISPMRWDEFIGKVASRDYNEDDLLCEP
ncbi:N-acetylneuraminate synthase [Desulfovibrio legallii]|uniref:N-acetylneuraminate synthase n=1 Tax=Desulfovibrio legallii TaxID=571438 RepID=A0A1G7J859_9BACT|nr:N-acetylneuraminate synthase [Desulfovibrio legallii]SDF21066.1 N-acetylneuraminate synthase [Desulfovibrio legallii]